MNVSGYAKRLIYALIACVLIVYLFGQVVAAFVPGAFTPVQIHLIDICIFIIGFCYVIWGETWFTARP